MCAMPSTKARVSTAGQGVYSYLRALTYYLSTCYGTMMLALLFLFVSGQAVPPDTVVIDPPSAVVLVGETQRFTARAYDGSGTEMQQFTVTWFTQDQAIAGVDSAGLATAYAPGVAQISAVVGGQPAYARLEVLQLPVSTLDLSTPALTVYEGTTVPLEVVARTALGDAVAQPVTFRSSRRRVAHVDAAGLVSGRTIGEATITVEADDVEGEVAVTVVQNPAVRYQIAQNRVSIRCGDVVRFRLIAFDASGAQVDGIHPQWHVPESGATIESDGVDGVFVAEEEGAYTITAVIGEDLSHSIVVGAEPRLYNAHVELVGRGPIDAHHSGDTWVFEGVNGRDYAYIGTFMHDWMKVWDVTNPSDPVLMDSIQVDARRINDVKIHASNRLAIITREGASSRRNGIVLLDLSTPAHPTILSEYTETVTGGVHNVWIEGNLVYACHNGTNDLHIIDIADPRAPKEVGRWGLEKRAKTLHDVIVQDGYAYLSYWDDGVVTLDVGAGTHGGTPTVPAFVSQLSYPKGNTHVAWRHGRYLFVGDEIWPEGYDADQPIDATGYIHVLDMTDMDRPVEVAFYEVPGAGAHNVWASKDRLYVGYYQGGLRVLDISGELRGDLYRQGREMGHLLTTDERTMVPGWPMAWGAQLHKGNIYTSDLNSGLWIVRLVETLLMP